MSITFHVLDPKNPESGIALIERIRTELACYCYGIKAYAWATPILNYNVAPQNYESQKPFSATTLTLDLFTDGHVWKVPHDTTVFIGEQGLDTYTCAAVLLKKHGQLTFDELGIMPDGNFIHRVALIDRYEKDKVPSEVLFTPIAYLQGPAADEIAVKEKVRNLYKWLIAGTTPVLDANVFVEAMKANPKTMGETLRAIAPFLLPEHYARLMEDMANNIAVSDDPTEVEAAFIKHQFTNAWGAWGVNSMLHRDTLAHWLRCFEISDPFYYGAE